MSLAGSCTQGSTVGGEGCGLQLRPLSLDSGQITRTNANRRRDVHMCMHTHRHWHIFFFECTYIKMLECKGTIQTHARETRDVFAHLKPGSISRVPDTVKWRGKKRFDVVKLL